LTNSSINKKDNIKENDKKLKGKSFLYNVGETSLINFDNFASFSSLSSSTVDQMDINYLPLNKKKESCFNCYKLVIMEELEQGKNINFYGKIFCGEICKKYFEKKNLVKISY
jgi:hypothetical protein